MERGAHIQSPHSSLWTAGIRARDSPASTNSLKWIDLTYFYTKYGWLVCERLFHNYITYSILLHLLNYSSYMWFSVVGSTHSTQNCKWSGTRYLDISFLLTGGAAVWIAPVLLLFLCEVLKKQKFCKQKCISGSIMTLESRTLYHFSRWNELMHQQTHYWNPPTGVLNKVRH